MPEFRIASLKLVGIGPGGELAGLQNGHDPDRVAQRAGQQVIHVADQLVDIDRLEHEVLVAGEGEELAGRSLTARSAASRA